MSRLPDLPVGLVARVLRRVARRERLKIDAVVRDRRGRQTGVAELLDQEGDALVAVSAVGVAGMGQEPDQRLVELHALRRFRPVGRDRALGALGRDGARPVRQEQADQGLEDEQVLAGASGPSRAERDLG